MYEIATIEATARVILTLCEDQGDMRTKLERIACAADVLKWQATADLEKIKSTEEVPNV